MTLSADLASNCGIDVFLWDWYWYGGEMTMQESLEEGFLKAPNRDKMKFCIMWCYHDRVDNFRDNLRQPKRMLMKLPRTPGDFLANIRYCVKFFKEPTYYFRNGMPFFSIYNSADFVKDMGGSEKAKEASYPFGWTAKSAAASVGRHATIPHPDRRVELCRKP